MPGTCCGVCTVADDDLSRTSNGKPGSSYELLFKTEVAIVDLNGGCFRVQYEGCRATSRSTSG